MIRTELINGKSALQKRRQYPRSELVRRLNATLSRLRTRMAWVQGAEQELEKRRLHCQPHLCYISLPIVCSILNLIIIPDVNVVKAFENAVALIGGT